MAVKHALTADGDPLVGASDWNDNHTVDNGSFVAAKLSATQSDIVFGRSSSGAGNGEEIAVTAAGRALLDDAAATNQRTTLGLAIGTDVPALAHTHAGTSNGSKLAQANTHESPDTDSGTSSLHHTLGAGANQAAAGNHTHSQVIASGTSNPGSPSTNDMYFRTDLGLLIYYDGTRWLTVAEYATGMTATLPGMTTGNTMIYAPINSTYDIYVTTVDVSTFVATTNNGTNYWTATANKTDAANSNTTLGSVNTSADSANTWVKHPISVGAVVTTSGFQILNVASSKTLSPGAFYFGAQFRYRLVIT